MRLYGRALFALVLAGCGSSVGEVDIGARQIPVVTVAGTIALPSAAERAGQAPGTWFMPTGEKVTLSQDGDRMLLSVSQEIEFFSAEQTRLFRTKLAGREPAVTRIDVEVQMLTLRAESATGLSPFSGKAMLGDTVLGPSGLVDRVSLSDDTRAQVIVDVEDGKAIDLAFGLVMDCPEHQVMPDSVRVYAVLQPILVVQSLSTL